MNRREAIAALTALPALTRISRAELKPNDVIVVETPGRISQESAARIEHDLLRIWPDNKIVVMSDGMQLKVVEGK